jgi:hypothetical protein
MQKHWLLFLLLPFSQLSAQFVYKWDAKSFSFTSPFELTQVGNNIDEFNWQNDEYTIEISSFGIGYYNTYYGGQEIKSVAKQVAKDLSFTDLKEGSNFADGDSLPLIPSGYYVLCRTSGMNANEYASVIVVVGFSEKKKIYFEARIYCFTNKFKKGIEIAKSFTFTK